MQGPECRKLVAYLFRVAVASARLRPSGGRYFGLRVPSVWLLGKRQLKLNLSCVPQLVPRPATWKYSRAVQYLVEGFLGHLSQPSHPSAALCHRAIKITLLPTAGSGIRSKQQGICRFPLERFLVRGKVRLFPRYPIPTNLLGYRCRAIPFHLPRSNSHMKIGTYSKVANWR